MHNNYDSSHYVVNSVLELLKATDDPIFYEFVKNFYSFSYSSDIKLSSKFLLNIAKNMYDFIQQRNCGEGKVKVFDVTQDQGTTNVFTVIEMVNDNLPFIVDSVIETIKRYGIYIYYYTNAVLNIERDDGVVKRISSLTNNAADHRNESVVYFIIKNVDDVLKEELQREIKRTLCAVKSCVEDWPLMLDHVNQELKRIENIDDIDSKEVCIFLEWLKKNNFVFLGYQQYFYSDDIKRLALKKNSNLGLYRVGQISEENKLVPQDKQLLCVVRSNVISLVHRSVYMDCITIRAFDDQGIITKESCFYGLFASIVSFQDATHIPIIRKKIRSIEERSGFVKGGHNNKALISILQRFSREELFQYSEDELFDISMGMLFLSSNPRVKLFIRKNTASNFVNCIIFIPKKRASTELAGKMREILQQKIQGKVVGHYYSMLDESDLVRLQFIFKVDDLKDYEVLERDIEKELEVITRKWEDRLSDLLQEKLGAIDHTFLQYLKVFPISYQDHFDPESAYYDIQKLHKVCNENISEVDLYITESTKNYQLKIYLPLEGNIKLSDILNIVKKMGMYIVTHSSYKINIKNGIWLHHFVLSNYDASFDHSKIKAQFEITLRKIFAHEIENDYFNSLVILANLQWKEALLIRALSRYLKQISFNYSQIYIQKTIIKYVYIIPYFIDLFDVRFNPGLDLDREGSSITIQSKINELLANVTDIVHDHILRSFYNLVLAILRTNYYQGDKDYLSIKFDSSKVPNIPLPCPFREIYVYSNLFEAIHLRGGKVARGGIRWSDRTEDFRTEVLGLMKAQMTKNAVIVPVGSKGGFILKRNVKDRSQLKDYAVASYKSFLRGMLDITDNIVVCDKEGLNTATKIITPQNIVKYDDDDPYLVVAADKGTASFSDYANQVSEEYNFWLADAFASGGSVGYDHKKMGITARGAWVAAQRHFWEIGKNIQREAFTVIGIGDMAGDVFGNGMLLSQQICLLGAFNHIHIFIDPFPNPSKSFMERQRLFNLSGSSWMDYDKSLISRGGGIFERSAKSIDISLEMKEAFGIKEDKLPPDELIVYLLKSPVDMIWNGGIGTYIKSSKETNAMVADKANDNLRVNGSEVRASMIVEGGNLGCTQLGRIEYAEHGGRVDTDFVDNAGGVICSDFEVNIKIFLKLIVSSGVISLEERNKILESMTDEITSMVLNHHNQLETKALMLECMHAKNRIEQHHRLLQYLEKIGEINRNIEFLPNDEEISRMYSAGKGFLRPQLAVLISYCRMFIKKEIMNSEMLLSRSSGLMTTYRHKYLVSYFPKYIQDKFYKYINDHQLKSEIFATCVANEVINRMGCVFVNHVIENTGVKADNVIKVYIVIKHLYKLGGLWDEIDKLDGKIDVNLYHRIIREVQKFIGQTTFWCFRNLSRLKEIEEQSENFMKKIDILENNIRNVLDKDSLEVYDNMINTLSQNDIVEPIVKKIVGLRFITSALDIIYIAEKIDLPIIIISKVYFKLRSLLMFNRIQDISVQMEIGSAYLQRIAIRGLIDDLSDYQCILTEDVLREIEIFDMRKEIQEKNIVDCEILNKVVNDVIEAWSNKNKDKLESYNNFFNEINKTQLDLSNLVLIIKRLEVFVNQKGFDV